MVWNTKLMDLEFHEVEVLISFHDGQMRDCAAAEDYQAADKHKQRREDWRKALDAERKSRRAVRPDTGPIAEPAGFVRPEDAHDWQPTAVLPQI